MLILHINLNWIKIAIFKPRHQAFFSTIFKFRSTYKGSDPIKGAQNLTVNHHYASLCPIVEWTLLPLLFFKVYLEATQIQNFH